MPQGSLVDTGGASSLLTGTLLYIIDNINLYNVNDYLVTVTTLGGAIWMVYKVIGQRLDNKIKRNELERNKENNRNT